MDRSSRRCRSAQRHIVWSMCCRPASCSPDPPRNLARRRKAERWAHHNRRPSRRGPSSASRHRASGACRFRSNTCPDNRRRSHRPRRSRRAPHPPSRTPHPRPRSRETRRRSAPPRRRRRREMRRRQPHHCRPETKEPPHPTRLPARADGDTARSPHGSTWPPTMLRARSSFDEPLRGQVIRSRRATLTTRHSHHALLRCASVALRCASPSSTRPLVAGCAP